MKRLGMWPTTLVLSAAPVALGLLAACGRRSDIGPFGTGGTGGGSSHASAGSTSATAMSSSRTGAPLQCDPPKQKAVIATDKLQALSPRNQDKKLLAWPLYLAYLRKERRTGQGSR